MQVNDSTDCHATENAPDWTSAGDIAVARLVNCEIPFAQAHFNRVRPAFTGRCRLLIRQAVLRVESARDPGKKQRNVRAVLMNKNATAGCIANCSIRTRPAFVSWAEFTSLFNATK
jgi:hypothetical protein